MNCSVLVMSCDAYEDTWQPFFKLYKKYWDCPYDTYICTEYKECKYAKTIKTTGSWTNRVRQALEQIKTEYVIFLLDDFFLRNKVDQKRLDLVFTYFKPNIACFNLEQVNNHKLAEPSLNGFKNRQNKQMYQCSCQPTVWNREKLINLLQEDMTPWEWETQILDSEYDFFINTGDLIFDIGYYGANWGIVRGKWATECIDLFEKENIKIDFSKRGFVDMKLSIIIPYRETKELTDKLLDKLLPQLTKETELILVEDGSKDYTSKGYMRVIHAPVKDYIGASSLRNNGLDNANGKYIAFIDSDDMVSDNYIATILEKAKQDFDYCYMSWKDTNGNEYIIDNEPPEWNKSVWNCIYNRELIGNERFDENRVYGEDWDFNDRVRKGKRENITDIMYIYTVNRNGSITQNYCQGNIREVKPITAQIVMYQKFLSEVGGIESFVYDFARKFYKEHDILFLHDPNEVDPKQIRRLSKLIKCQAYNGEDIVCETYLNCNFSKNIADNVTATSGNYIDMAHTDYGAMGWSYQAHPKTTLTVCVSETVETSLKQQYPRIKTIVIPNFILPIEPKRTLYLVSATRLSWEKGYERMKMLAKRLNEHEIPFLWQVFTPDKPDEEIDGFVFMNSRLDVTNFTNKADYFIQLSETEGDGRATKEALSLGTPVIATKYPAIIEQGFVDGKHGYLLDFELNNIDDVINKMYDNKLEFEPFNFDYSGMWNFLGKKQKSNYIYDEKKILQPIQKTKWVVKTDQTVKGDDGITAKKGQFVVVNSIQRQRMLIDYGLIERSA